MLRRASTGLRLIRRHTRREILDLRAPITLLLTEHKLQNPTFGKEVVAQPILRPGLTVSCRALDVDGLVARVEVDVADRGHLAREGVPDTNFFEERRCNQVHVLARDGPQAHHREDDEGAHGATVVIPGDARHRGVEEGGDIGMGLFCRQSRAACVVELEDGQEGLLVTDVEEA